MGSVVGEMVPLIIGAAVVPVNIIMILILLRGENGLLKASALVGGMTLVRLVQGILFGYVIGRAAEPGESGRPGHLVSLLLLVVGILLLITGIKQWRKEDDPDAPPPQWMEIISGLSPLRAFGIGVLLVLLMAKLWIFTLSAIALIGEAGFGTVTNVLLFLYYVLAAESLLLAPILVSVAAPTQSADLLAGAQNWLERHNRAIVTGVALLFGTFFLLRGLQGFLA